MNIESSELSHWRTVIIRERDVGRRIDAYLANAFRRILVQRLYNIFEKDELLAKVGNVESLQPYYNWVSVYDCMCQG